MKIKILWADQLFRMVELPQGATVGEAVCLAGFSGQGYALLQDGVTVSAADVLTDTAVVTLMPLALEHTETRMGN